MKIKNPVTGDLVPLYTANFVLMDYGTGAVMAVPAHDERDHAFAKKYKLPVKMVIQSEGVEDKAFTEEGILVNSGEFTGLTSAEAKKKIPLWLQNKNLGKPTVNYKLRDWGLSRQRYWGAPIPIVHCEKCGAVPVSEKELPVVLPEDVPFTGEGASPLTKSETFLKATCSKCGGAARRDTFVESIWYYLKYCTLPQKGTDAKPFTDEDLKYWLPIDQYIGGIEHATMHLLYFRFYHRVLQDLGITPKELGREPALRLLNQGIVYKDGAKMSKSKGNIVDPDGLIKRFGADTTRLFVLFAAPPEKVLEWSDAGVEGSYRFLGRVWRLLQSHKEKIAAVAAYSGSHSVLSGDLKKLRTKTHQTIQKVTSDLDHDFRFNTAISAVMELVNEIYLLPESNDANYLPVLKESIESVVRLLNPFAPHLTEELWNMLGHKTLLSAELWKDHDKDAVVLDTMVIVVQVNGKLRANLELSKSTVAEEVQKLAAQDTKVQPYLEGKTIAKCVYVPGKLVNFVVK